MLRAMYRINICIQKKREKLLKPQAQAYVILDIIHSTLLYKVRLMCKSCYTIYIEYMVM